MRIDVFPVGLPPAPSDLAGRVVVVIDVLRASTTIAVALANAPSRTVRDGCSDAHPGRHRLAGVHGRDAPRRPRGR